MDYGWLAVIVFALLAAVSVPQLVWTRRVVEQVRAWLTNARCGIELAPFASLSRWAQWGWLVVVALALAVGLEAQFDISARAEERTAISVAVAIWSLIQCILSGKSRMLCEQVSLFSAIRQLDARGLVTAAQALPQGVHAPVSEESLQGRLNTLGRATLVWFVVLFVHIVVAGVVLIAIGLSSIVTSAGQLLLMFLLIAIPGLIAVYVVRCVVEVRARRAQFLWFLAVTTKSQRPLASELMGWGRAHPGRYGSRVMEVARDIGTGVSLADALQAQSGLITPSDLMSLRVAEHTGTLAATLRDCAMRQTQSLKGDSVVRHSSSTAIWLWAIVVVAISITSFLMYYIVPKFKFIFMGFGSELPGVTVLLIALSDTFEQYGPFVCPVFAALSMVLLWACGEAFLLGWSETWLAWRLGYGRQSEIPRLLRRMRGAVVSKLPWPAALQPMVLNHSQNDIRSRLERVLGRVSAGMGVWPAMRDSGLLNARDVSLLEMAERANNLEWALSALAESKERSLVHRWQVLLTLSVPVFTVVAGLAVMLICSGFFMPLVKLLNDLSVEV